ncbi:MAG: hypothetical protein N4A71_02140 [Carboxylicivirga sp.]|jgi:hypothetical protein|nr:hypothetical protein [Carboxylicivirga sp.]
MASHREECIILKLLDEGVLMIDNGSDIAVAVASIVDKYGNIKHPVNDNVHFKIKGEGELVGNASNAGNPRKVEWVDAPILIRTFTKPGTIKITGSLIKAGVHVRATGVLEIDTKPTVTQLSKSASVMSISTTLL